MDTENMDTGEKTHIETPIITDTEQWSDPYEIESPRIKIKENGRIFEVAEINFAAKYATFLVTGETFSFTADNGATVYYEPGTLCMKHFDDILIE